MSKNNRKKRMNSDNVKGYQREIISWDNPTKGQPHSNLYKIRISS